MLKSTLLSPLEAFLPVMSKQPRGIFQQEELSHVGSKAGTKPNMTPRLLACSIQGPCCSPTSLLGIQFTSTFEGLSGGEKRVGVATHLLEVVRLKKFAVIQQVCQMGHKPPVAQGDAVGSDTKARRKVRVRSHGPHDWGISIEYHNPGIQSDAGNVDTE